MIRAPDQSARDEATDISRSVIVQAPAGSGKTTLLVERYLKLLAVVEKPEEILAITFTRKAASEMASRILDALQQAEAPESNDTDSLAPTVSIAAHAALARSAEQGWQLLSHPARLKIQTIDSLALSLTRGLPVAAGLEPSLGLTENAGPLYLQAASRLLLRLYEDGPLTDEIADFLGQCDNDALKAERLLATMLGKRDQWLEVIQNVVAVHQTDPEQVARVLSQGVCFLNQNLIERFRQAVGDSFMFELDELVDHAAAELDRSFESNSDRYQLIGEILTTAKGLLRKQVTKRDGFSPQFKAEKARLMDLIETLKARELEQLAANLRYLPGESLSPETTSRLVKVCINLALANAELASTFSDSGVTDFTTLILNAQAALGDSMAPSELALALDYRIHHVLVDEFQDTSVSQFQLFEKLLRGWTIEDGNTFFAVGDPMQSIYRFRDADVGLFYRAWNQGIADLQLDNVILTSNFRADENLVHWANHAFERIMGNQQDPVLGQIAYRAATPTRKNPTQHAAVRLQQFDDARDQVEGITVELERLLADTEGSIALLVRSRRQLTDLIRTLRARGISWRANDIDPLLDKPVVSDLLALVGALADPYDRLSWMSLLRAPFIGLLLEDLQAVAEIEEFPALLGAIESGSAEVELSEDGRRRLERLAEAWPQSRGAVFEMPPRSLVETLWLKLGGADAYADPAALLHAGRLLELLDGLGVDALSSAALGQAASRLFAADLSSSRLEILTVHKAKGLEFDHVLLPFLERTTRSDEAELLLWRALPEGLLMGIRGDDGPFEWLARENRFRERHERQRLFYVACTRAKSSLTLFASAVDRPPETAMLSLLWDQLTEEDCGGLVHELPSAQRPTAHPDFFSAAPSAPTAERPLIRLINDYQWLPTVLPALPQPLGRAPERTVDQLDARSEVVLGIVVHGALERLGRQKLPVDVNEYRVRESPGWAAMARERELDEDAVNEVVQSAGIQLVGVLNHDQGQWLLSAGTDAHAELAVTGLVDGSVQNLVIDRTFAEEGIRWVIDFKTAIPHPDIPPDAFIDAEVSRYRQQLERYGALASDLFGQETRLAIYFTALPQLVLL